MDISSLEKQFLFSIYATKYFLCNPVFAKTATIYETIVLLNNEKLICPVYLHL